MAVKRSDFCAPINYTSMLGTSTIKFSKLHIKLLEQFQRVLEVSQTLSNSCSPENELNNSAIYTSLITRTQTHIYPHRDPMRAPCQWRCYQCAGLCQRAQRPASVCWHVGGNVHRVPAAWFNDERCQGERPMFALHNKFHKTRQVDWFTQIGENWNVNDSVRTTSCAQCLALTHAHTHTYTHMHTHMHTLSNTCTHTHNCKCKPPLPSPRESGTHTTWTTVQLCLIRVLHGLTALCWAFLRTVACFKELYINHSACFLRFVCKMAVYF
jgi:hypothetical protein